MAARDQCLDGASHDIGLASESTLDVRAEAVGMLPGYFGIQHRGIRVGVVFLDETIFGHGHFIGG
jgi:hypothetical protein